MLRSRLLFLLQLAVLLILFSMVNVLVIEHPYRLDLTTAKIYSLSENARKIIEKVSKPVHIVFAYDLRNRALKDSASTLQALANNSEFISVHMFDPILEPSLAEANGIRFSGSGVFKSEGRVVSFNEPTEVGFINALVQVVSEKMGLVCFSEGHIESNPFSLQTHDHSEDTMTEHNHSTGGRPITLHERHGMGMARESLELLGFEVEQRLLIRGPDSLTGCSILVVASPQTAFHDMEKAVLKNYLENSGRVLFLLEPDVRSGLEDLLSEYGVSAGRSRVKDLESHYWADPSTPAISNYPRHRVTRDLPLSFFPGAIELRPAQRPSNRRLRTDVLISTGLKSVLEGEEDSFGPRTLGVITKDLDTEAVLIVIGDGDFSTNSFFGQLGNGPLFIKLINELTRNENFADISPRHYVEGSLTLSRNQLSIVFLTNVFLGPLILLFVGVVIWRSRR